LHVAGPGHADAPGGPTVINFPTANPLHPAPIGSSGNAFVAKLNAAGSALVYSTYLGGGNDWGFGIAVDGAGNAYVTGRTYSTNFPTTAGAFQPALGGSGDAFAAQFDAAGKALADLPHLGGGNDWGFGIAVDGAGNAYVTGRTYSTNFPTTAGAFQPALGGSGDAFVAKLNAAGNALVYSTYLGGSDLDQGNGIAVDGTG